MGQDFRQMLKPVWEQQTVGGSLLLFVVWVWVSIYFSCSSGCFWLISSFILKEFCYWSTSDFLMFASWNLISVKFFLRSFLFPCSLLLFPGLVWFCSSLGLIVISSLYCNSLSCHLCPVVFPHPKVLHPCALTFSLLGFRPMCSLCLCQISMFLMVPPFVRSLWLSSFLLFHFASLHSGLLDWEKGTVF